MELISDHQASIALPQENSPQYQFYRRWVGPESVWKSAALAHKYGSKKYCEVLVLNYTCHFGWTTVYTVSAVSRYSVRGLIVWLMRTILRRVFN
jgi:hypothetical protein